MLDIKGKKHRVCQTFWCKVYQISTKTVYRKLKQTVNSPLRVRKPSIRGLWDREKTWKSKVDEKRFIQWINQQPRNFSHFTRRLDKKMKLYFINVDSYKELYRKYVQEIIFEEKKPMSERSFRRYLKKHCHNYRFKKSHLDACGVCIRLKAIGARANQREDLELKTKGKVYNSLLTLTFCNPF